MKKKKSISKIIIIIVAIILGIGLLLLLMWPTISKAIRDDFYNPSPFVAYKPIIYIYPTKDIDVNIKVSNPELFTVTYPKYNDGWQVKALTDGTLIDKNDKKYYALYWEGNNKNTSIVKEDGFIVKGKDSASFLEEKLEILGLNYKERNEFIMYWLPKLEKNKYNYIRFQTQDEINNNMELYVDPKPDTIIRVRMDYKALDKKIKVKTQELTKVERSGYTVVEWGGTEF